MTLPEKKEGRPAAARSWQPHIRTQLARKVPLPQVSHFLS